MYIDFSFFITFILNMPSAVVLLVCICISGCLCPIYLIVWRAGMASLWFMYRPTSLASADEHRR